MEKKKIKAVANGAGLKWINVNCKKQCLRQTKPDCSWPLANIDSLSLENPLIYFFHFISDYHFKIGRNILKQRRGPPFSSRYSGFHLNVSLFPNAVFKEASPGQQPPRWWGCFLLAEMRVMKCCLCPSALFLGIHGAGRVLKYPGISFPGSWQPDLRDTVKCIPGMSNFRPASPDSSPGKKNLY